MSQLGRISGQLLKENLTRNGHDLAFETDLLYLSVVDPTLPLKVVGIGINTNAPTAELDVNGTTQTTDLEVTTQATLANITISTDTISSSTGILNLVNGTGDQVNYQTKLVVDDVSIDANVIATTAGNVNLELRPNKTGVDPLLHGTVDIYADTNIFGNLTVSGNIQTDGNIILGDGSGPDTVTFDAEIASDIIPDGDNTRQLGNGGTKFDSTGDFTLGDATLTVSSSGTVVTLSIPAAGPTWVNTLTAHTTGKSYELVLDGISGSYNVNTTAAWIGTNPQTVLTTNDGLLDGVYDIVSIRFDQKRWKDLWVQNIYADNITTGDIVVDNVNLSLRPGNLYFVSTNGNNANSGDHQNDPFLTLEHALSVATSGDSVFIYPGTYSEAFPLTVPTGVAIRGESIRSVKITPTTATRYNDAFLLNGESTIEDLTVADFFSNGNYFTVTSASAGSTTFNVGVAPFAHTWVSGGTINISGTDYAVTGATYTHTTGVVTVTHAGPDATGLTIFLSNLTFSCNGGNRVFPDNGYAFRFAADYTVTSRSPYIRNITVLTKGSVTSISDPLGFDEGDAGKGAYIDGAYATASSNEASLLFHSATFICPGVDCITMTNGVRVEWLNSFIYYANIGLKAFDSNDGFAQQGLTRLKLPAATRTGTWAVSDTVSYYDTDGTTVLASGVVDSIDGDWINLGGRIVGFEIPADRAPKTVVVNGDAKLSTAQKKFGTASLVLDGTGDYLTAAPQADFEFSTGNFTLEGWFYFSTLAANAVLFDFRSAPGQAVPSVTALSTGALVYYTNGATQITSLTSVLTTGTWHHIAVARQGTDTRLFLNGSQVGSTWTDSTTYIEGSLTLGNNYVNTSPMHGYIDDVRISKGVARYTSTFTSPAAPFLADTSTVLLLHFNGANNSTIITDDGVTYVDIRSSSLGTTTDLVVADYSDFGAEIRSIGSACVYGNYGIEGNGPGVIAYLIGQNLAYIGNGKASTNDPNTVIQANEVVTLNDAKIYYQSVDHKGDYRIGDLFYVNQETGEVTFSNSNVSIGTSLTFDNGLGDVTYVDATKIETGDFRISGNTIETLSQDFNIQAASNLITLQSNVNITGDLDVTGDVTIGGHITIGDQSTDTVSFVAGVNSDIIPNNPASVPVYNLGTSSKQWLNLYSTQITIADVQIDTNVVRTTATDTDLTLSANGTGRIYVPTNDVEIAQDLTVNGTTTLQDVNIGAVLTPATITHIGDVTQVGNLTQTGDIDLTGTLTTSGYAQFADIRIDSNELKTTVGNNDLTLSANGTGKIYIPSNDVQIDQNLTVTGYIDVTTLDVDTTISSSSFTTGDIVIDNNTIYTTLSNNDLVLQAAGTGKIYVPSNDVQLDQNLTVNGTTNLKDTTIVGTVTHTGNVTQVGNVTQTGSTEITGTLTVGSTAQFQDIKVDANVITTTIGNNNLVLEAAGTGRVIVPSDDVEIAQTLTITGTTGTTTINNTGTVTSGTFSTGDISINSNTIQTTATNSNLQLSAAGTGYIVLEQFDVQENEIRINTGSDLTLTPNGTGIVSVNSTQSIKIPVGATADRPVGAAGMIRFNTDLTRYEGYNGTTWVRLDGVEDADGNTKITAELTPGANDNTIRFYTNGSQVADLNSSRLNTANIDVGDINISTNVISTTTTDTNLVLSPNGTGQVRIGNFAFSSNVISNTVNNSVTVISQTGDGYVKINSTGGFVIPVGRTDERPSVYDTGMMRFNTTDQRVEIWNGTAWVGVAQGGAGGGVTQSEATDISILSAIIFG